MASFLAGSCASQTMYRRTDRHRKGRHTWEERERGTSGGSVRTCVCMCRRGRGELVLGEIRVPSLEIES